MHYWEFCLHLKCFISGYWGIDSLEDNTSGALFPIWSQLWAVTPHYRLSEYLCCILLFEICRSILKITYEVAKFNCLMLVIKIKQGSCLLKKPKWSPDISLSQNLLLINKVSKLLCLPIFPVAFSFSPCCLLHFWFPSLSSWSWPKYMHLLPWKGMVIPASQISSNSSGKRALVLGVVECPALDVRCYDHKLPQ